MNLRERPLRERPGTLPEPAAAPLAPLRRAATGTVALRVAVAGALCAGLVLRFATTSALWLDEALSVSIAQLPLP